MLLVHTNITNSYLGYLGYEAGWGKKAEGLHYNGGDGSIVRNNNIDHVYFGFYSVGVGNMLIENNLIHDSGHYGIDPHTGTHDMIIRNNSVYNNNGTAIICSLDCYNIVFDGNRIHNNNGAGISFSRNTSNSVARNNILFNQETPIEITTSHNDIVYNNVISNTSTAAITLKAGSSNNKIFNNTISNARFAISSDLTSQNNKIGLNILKNTPIREPLVSRPVIHQSASNISNISNISTPIKSVNDTITKDVKTKDVKTKDVKTKKHKEKKHKKERTSRFKENDMDRLNFFY